MLTRLCAVLQRLASIALGAVASPDKLGVGAGEVADAFDGADGLQGVRKTGGIGAHAPLACPPSISLTLTAPAPLTPLCTRAGVGTYFDAAEDDGDAGDVVAEEGDAGEGPVAAPRAQMIVTACWLTVKELALCTGELAERVPLAPGGGRLLAVEQARARAARDGAAASVAAGYASPPPCGLRS